MKKRSIRILIGIGVLLVIYIAGVLYFNNTVIPNTKMYGEKIQSFNTSSIKKAVDNKNIANNLSDEDFLKELGEESSSPKENKTLSELSDEDFLKYLGEKSSLESLSDEDFLSQLEENIPVNKLSDEDFFANL